MRGILTRHKSLHLWLLADLLLLAAFRLLLCFPAALERFAAGSAALRKGLGRLCALVPFSVMEGLCILLVCQHVKLPVSDHQDLVPVLLAKAQAAHGLPDDVLLRPVRLRGTSGDHLHRGGEFKPLADVLTHHLRLAGRNGQDSALRLQLGVTRQKVALRNGRARVARGADDVLAVERPRHRTRLDV